MNALNRISSFIFALFLILTAVVFSALTASAAGENVNFEMQSAEYKPNRVFTVAVYAKADAKITAGIFDITYDPELIEFRKARAAESSSDVEINQSDGEIRLVYLNSDGKDISAGEAIFALTFKTLEEGTGKIEFEASECCGADAEFLTVGECTASTVTVSSSASGTVTTASVTSGSSGSSSKTSSSSSGTKSSKTSSSTSQKAKETTSESGNDETSENENPSLELNSADDGRLGAFFSGMGIVLGLGSIIAVIFFIGKKYGMNVSKQNGAVNTDGNNTNQNANNNTQTPTVDKKTDDNEI